MKGLKRHILDFEIVPTGNPKTLVFVDASQYMGVPERPLLEITLPGYSRYFLVNVTASAVNTFNSNTIGLTSLLNGDSLVNLPDGIYSFRYKICPYTLAFINKNFFRTTLLEDRLAVLYDRLDGCSSCSPKSVLSDLAEVVALIEGAKIMVNKNEKKANDFYKLASRLIDGVMCDIDKTCK